MEFCLADLQSTMDFITKDITDEELEYFNEIVQLIVLETNDKHFVDLLNERVSRTKDESIKAYMLDDMKEYYSYLHPTK